MFLLSILWRNEGTFYIIHTTKCFLFQFTLHLIAICYIPPARDKTQNFCLQVLLLRNFVGITKLDSERLSGISLLLCLRNWYTTAKVLNRQHRLIWAKFEMYKITKLCCFVCKTNKKNTEIHSIFKSLRNKYILSKEKPWILVKVLLSMLYNFYLAT